jgi:acetoacetyl-CoA synthetase
MKQQIPTASRSSQFSQNQVPNAGTTAPVLPRQTWCPDPVQAKQSALGRFAKQHGFDITEYDALWRWSISDPVAYWSEVWNFTGLQGSLGKTGLTNAADMATARFFDDGLINVAENLLAGPSEALAIVQADAKGRTRRWTFGELRDQVEAVASWLRRNGVNPGDVVATVAPNRIEAVVSFLACAAVGGTWTSCSPELSADAILDRVGQIEPKVLFICRAYTYNSKQFDFSEVADKLVASLPTLQAVIVVGQDSETPYKTLQNSPTQLLRYSDLTESAEPFEWRRFAFNTPVLVMYTSGTTGKPKAIVHSGGGVLLKLASEHAFHFDFGPGDVAFWYTNTSWMMFHWLVFALARGSAIVLYDDAAIPKSANGPDLGALWRIAESAGVTAMGVSPSYLTILSDAGYSPKQHHNLTGIRNMLAAGAPSSAEQFEWIHANVSATACYCPSSGGTEILSGFVGGSPLHPVKAGEMSCKFLGMAVDVLDARGMSVTGQKGELVCTQPFPSMPLTFWGADGDARYHAAYFEGYPKVWTHGDLAEQTLSGGVIIYGRSDTTLNPGGIRIGTSEIYRPLSAIAAIEAAIVFGRSAKNNEEIVLCVKLSEGRLLDQDLAAHIRTTIRNQASPRHVPHAIYQVHDIPYTHNGKAVEVAAKAAAASLDLSRFSGLSNPECLDEYANLNSAVSL